MRRLLSDYPTLRDLLTDYSRYCKPGEVALRDSAGDHAPSDLLNSLSSKELGARIVGINAGGGNPTEITTRISGFFSSSEHRYAVIWSRERHGWAEPPSSGSRTVHYFVPRHRMTDPPYCADEMLVALCKRNWTNNDSPFWPTDPKYDFCKTCRKRYDDFIAQFQ